MKEHKGHKFKNHKTRKLRAKSLRRNEKLRLSGVGKKKRVNPASYKKQELMKQPIDPDVLKLIRERHEQT